MTPLYLSVNATADGGLTIDSTDSNGHTMLTEVVETGPELERARTLCRAMRDGAQSASLLAELSQVLGSILFVGAIGDLLRQSISQTEVSGVLLTVDDVTDEWPWELATDPQTGIRPAVDAGIVRVWGREHRPSAMARHGLLVIPKNQGAAKIKAVQAAASGVARKHDLSVYPADPATGPGLRRLLEDGAAILHLETDGDSRANLDDGPVPLDRLGIGSGTWFTILSGTKATRKDARYLRTLGAPLVLGSQLDTSPHQVSAVYRAVYKSLSRGESVAGALVRARFALEKVGGTDDFSWAAPILYVSPVGSTGAPALEPFPPSFRTTSAVPGSTRTTESAAALGSPTTQHGALSAPMSAAAFVTETLRVLTLNQGSDADRLARAQTLRVLGGQQPAGTPEDLAGLSPNERIRTLADSLISHLARPDDALGRPEGFERHIEHVAQQNAVCPLTVQRVAMAVRASRLMCILAADTGDGVRLAEAVATGVYGYHLRRVPPHATGRLFTPPTPGHDQQFTTGGGWLYRTIASNWRRDEIDPFQPEQADPASRMPLVSRSVTGWRVHEGGWLIISNAERMSERELIALSQTLDAQVYETISDDGRVCRLKVPNDFRVILVSNWRPSDLPKGTPTVALNEISDISSCVERWLGVAADRVGAPVDTAGAGGRRLAAEFISGRVNWLRLGTDCTNAMAETALCHAILLGGEPASAGLAGLQAVLDLAHNDYHPSETAFITAVLSDEWKTSSEVKKRLLDLNQEELFRCDAAYVHLLGTAGARRNDASAAVKNVIKGAPEALFLTS